MCFGRRSVKAKESKRMTSTASRINRHHVASLFWTLVAVDFVILLTILLTWAYMAEKAALGDAWVAGMNRRAEWTEGLSFFDTLRSVVYRFSLPEGEPFHAQAGSFLIMVSRAGMACLGFEALTLVHRWRSGRQQIMRLLAPLHQMSETAQQLSQAGFDEQKFHDLEHAIEALSPTAPDARLSTGDSDLESLENAVNNLLGRLHASYRQQIRFVSDASHELRTPISVIRGYAEMLDRWGKDDKKILGEGITAIRTETDNMQQLVEQLLFLARGDAGRNQPQMKPVDLAKLMQELHEEYTMIDKGHVWQLQQDGPVPATGDQAQLKQAARILCDNALKYSPQGEPIVLRAFFDEQGAPCFSVQDHGQGISSADIPHIFERFYRADPARARNSGGTGLGLSIAKWIVDRHGGYFRVISREEVGTRMVVCLPGIQANASVTS